MNEANLSVNSLLKIIEELKKEITELRKENAELRKMILERDAIIADQNNIIAEQNNKIKELEERLKRHSQNSNQPPSTDQYAKKSRSRSEREKGKRKSGGQPGHKGTTLRPVEDPDKVIYCEIDYCTECNCDLSAVQPYEHTKRQECDIPPVKPMITEYRIGSKICPKCNCINKARGPKYLTQEIQYGPNIDAFAAYLHYEQLIPLKRIQGIFDDLFSLQISEGTLVNKHDLLFNQLSSSESMIHENLLASPVNNCDETSIRINGKTKWLHVVSNSTNTAYFSHDKRGTEAMDAMGILPQFEGVLVHDHWKPYFTYQNADHSLCNAHHIRELRGINENYNQLWAKEMRQHLLDINKVVNECKNMGMTNLSDEQIKEFSQKYDEILDSAISQIPTLKEESSKSKKCGRIKQHPAKNLHDRLAQKKEDTLRFMSDFRVPFTNNQAEQDIRMTKVKLKISGSFRSQDGAIRFCRIRGYISTSRKRGLNILESLKQAIRGHPESFQN